MQFIYAVTVVVGDAKGLFGPWISNERAVEFAAQKCNELGLEFDYEHECSHNHVFEDPTRYTLPYVCVDYQELHPPFNVLLAPAIIELSID